MNRSHRGSALLAALMVIAVLALVTVATFRLAAISKNQATRDARALAGVACIDTSRQYLIGRLRNLGLLPTEIILDQAITVDSGTRRIFTGHARPTQYDSNGIARPVGDVAVIKTVRAIPPKLVGFARSTNRDIGNIIGSPILGGQVYRVVVTCTDPLSGDMELEFTFKYGL